MAAARSTNISFTNQTPDILTLTSSSLSHGIWTSTPPPTIGPFSTGSWQSESDGILTGTEGQAAYAVGITGATTSVWWDNPYAGTNKYSIDVSPGLALYQDGWSGENATVKFTLEPTIFHGTNFRPSTHGFAYGNNWPDAPLTKIDLGVAEIPIGNAEAGLCGGMVYAALDYYAQGTPPPPARPNPAIGVPLYDYFVTRLIDSFDLPDLPVTLYTIMNPVYPDTGSAGNPLEGRSPIVIKDAWPQIRSWINAGWPSPICIQKTISLNPVDLGENHQILVWGYSMNGQWVKLFIYDPNEPMNDAVTLDFNASSILNPLSIVPSPGLGPVYCFLTTAYEQKTPPQ